ncbi:MAG: hypothetical protein IT336_08185, partial [Thermomicrobiales bacterium]|nr:hypothetical protein [Thermomicrobiales bacterium]
RQLAALLATHQLDLLRYRVELFDGSAPPAMAIARSVVQLQSLVTAVFDAVRSGPKRHHHPSHENLRMSSLSFASVPGTKAGLYLSIPNDRLLVLASDLDATFELIFELLAARSKTILRNLAARVGIASVVAAHAWAENAVQHGLTTTIGWRKANDERRTVALSHSDALLFKTAVESVTDDSVDEIDRPCELLAIDEAAGTFRIEATGSEVIAGTLGEGFARGGNWTTHHWYTAVLHRAVRVRYATGEETVRWSLRRLIPEG